MFGLFKKKSEKEKLIKQREKVLKKAYQISRIDRKKSDELYAEVKQIEDRITELDNN